MLLSLYSEVGKGVTMNNPVTYCCACCSGVPMPVGQEWADMGMKVNAAWMTAEEMLYATQENRQSTHAAPPVIQKTNMQTTTVVTTQSISAGTTQSPTGPAARLPPDFVTRQVK